MPKFVFGKAIEFLFQPTINGDPVAVHSLVASRIYEDEPTEAQIEDTETGHISEITSWTDEGDFTKKITFPALTDSDPHSSSPYETYYVATNYRFESGGPVVFALEVIHVWRPDANTSRITTDYTDLLALEPKLSDLKTTAQLTTFVTEAKTRIFRRMKGDGKERYRLFSLEELDDSTMYLALSMVCFSLFTDQAPHWKDKALLYREAYEEVFKQTRVGYDLDGDDNPEPTEHTQKTSSVYLVR